MNKPLTAERGLMVVHPGAVDQSLRFKAPGQAETEHGALVFRCGSNLVRFANYAVRHGARTISIKESIWTPDCADRFRQL
jgi:hypothetical protein